MVVDSRLCGNDRGVFLSLFDFCGIFLGFSVYYFGYRTVNYYLIQRRSLMFKSGILIVACFLFAGCVESVSYHHYPRRRPVHPPVCRPPVCHPHRPPMPHRAPVVIVKPVPVHGRHHRPMPKHGRYGHGRYVSSVVYR